MLLFLKFIIFNNQSHSTIIHLFLLFAEAGLIISSSLLRSAREEPPWGAETRFELGPALQQADALTAELRRLTLTTLHPKLTIFTP
jgi:hypothetical protein